MTVVSVLTTTALLNHGCRPRGAMTTSQATKPPSSPLLLEEGQRLYAKQCAVCHGATGAGDGAAAYLLYPKPRDFTQNEFRLVSTNTMQATDEDLFLTMTRGMPGSAMPSWEALTPERRWALVYYVRHLTGVSDPIDPASIIQVPPETPSTSEGLERGRQIFAQACASCHGPQGRGDGQQVMTDNAGFPIKPRDLTAGVFKGSSESTDLYYRIMAGLPGSPMPSYAGAYTDEQVWDLIHYVQSLVPDGKEDQVRLHPRAITAARMSGMLPEHPTDGVWDRIAPVTVALTPLWWREDRIEQVEVKALHNGKELAIHLAWADPTHDASLVTPQRFSDAAAVQFSADQQPPFFGMGDAEAPVTIWLWKAAWQEDVVAWGDVEQQYAGMAVDWYPGQQDYAHGDRFEVSEAKTASQDRRSMTGWEADNPLSNPARTTAAEEAAAKGLGTFTSKPAVDQRVHATGLWQDGRWQVVLHRPMAAADKAGLSLRPGHRVHIAFALFDGAAKDRNGQKHVSIWNTLKLER
jgi:mono/diheme cytochrome c family protein